ncbi:hypothetical protein PoB_006478300 [Plakobranchus ocellatus]|uniref:Uncharacterized protein n=1 Tax=Plakobranchus ocellatus TaxID=259542 RepID=A0AAV4D272_9GAST|nr:hypothetical protein PoB_006478300 [Plakobranchus ocellatus]
MSLSSSPRRFNPIEPDRYLAAGAQGWRRRRRRRRRKARKALHARDTGPIGVPTNQLCHHEAPQSGTERDETEQDETEWDETRRTDGAAQGFNAIVSLTIIIL